MGIKRRLTNKIPGNNAGLQVGLVPPHPISRKETAAHWQKPRPMLQSHMGHILRQFGENIQKRNSPRNHICARGLAYVVYRKRRKN